MNFQKMIQFSGACPVCDMSDATVTPDLNGLRVDCPTCGNYFISELASHALPDSPTWTTDRKQLSRAIRFAFDHDKRPVVENAQSAMALIAELDKSELAGA